MLNSLFTFTLNSGAFQHIGGRHPSGTLGNNLVSIVRVLILSWCTVEKSCVFLLHSHLKCLRAKLFLYPGLPSLICVLCLDVFITNWPTCTVPEAGNTGTESSWFLPGPLFPALQKVWGKPVPSVLGRTVPIFSLGENSNSKFSSVKSFPVSLKQQ